ncbi:MAG: hypothetical protein KGJ40_05405 [candidate division NC10 bacterium]|nr:hypothetical protein [candidate division NC10 bacterium]
MKALIMRLHRNRLRIVLLTFALLGMIAVAPPVAHAATFLVINNDGAGEGFNDPTAVAAVGGNTGTTVGAQRLIAFQYAADIWGGLLASSVTIRVGAQFNPLSCSASSAVLGSAGPTTSYRDFTGAPVAATWYPIALANALHGSDLNTGLDDISATFSSTIGTPGCLELSGWYYGLDATPPAGKIDFVSVLLHEMGHGLGFLTFVNLTTGAKLLGFNDTFMRNLEDHGATPSDYPSMSDAQRVTASTDTGNLHWVGANVMAASAGLSAGTVGTHVRMYAPNPAQSGSSVSHWDTALTPNQIMEPSYTGPLHNPVLELPLFQDIGWTLLSTSFTLTTTKAGTGTGTVTSSPAGISCGATCSASFASGTAVTLTATPASDSTFAGWSGDCNGSGQVTMNANKSCTATFTRTTTTVTLTVTMRGSGPGTVTSAPAGINCTVPGTCVASYTSGTTVTLTEAPGSGASFKSWGGSCSGTATTCSLTLTANQSVTATFSRVFTDPTLTAGSTRIKAVHVTELRSAINTLRAVNSLAAFTWTDPTLTVGSTLVKKVHLDELRTALGQVYQAAGQSAPSYTDPTLTAGSTRIKAVHVTELRTAVRALE